LTFHQIIWHYTFRYLFLFLNANLKRRIS
jgi:hypothetical protein